MDHLTVTTTDTFSKLGRFLQNQYFTPTIRKLSRYRKSNNPSANHTGVYLIHVTH